MDGIKRLQSRIFDESGNIEPEIYRGKGRYQLSIHEEHVFKLEIEDMPLYVEAYAAYEAFKGKKNNQYSEDQLLFEAVKRSYTNLMEDRASKLEFMLFAEKLELSEDKADALYTKIEWWDRRQGTKLMAVPIDASL